MPRSIAIVVAALAGAALIAAACGGDSKKDATATPAAQSTAAKTSAATTAAKTPAAGVTANATTAATAASGSTPGAAATAPAAPPSGKKYTAEDAAALLLAASLKPTDVAADWKVMSDTSLDNAAAAAADPSSAASIERCGRLAGRLATNQPADTVSAYLGGTIVTAFSQLTVYSTAAGAADCSAEGAAKFSAPGALARAFGSVFVNPDAVVVTPVDYPQVGEGSFATSLTGDINAAGTVVGLQIVIVAFLKGNTSAVVGIAYSPLTTPTTTELKPLVDLVLQRITANQ